MKEYLCKRHLRGVIKLVVVIWVIIVSLAFAFMVGDAIIDGFSQLTIMSSKTQLSSKNVQDMGLLRLTFCKALVNLD
jgi:hypothetical protein